MCMEMAWLNELLNDYFSLRVRFLFGSVGLTGLFINQTDQ